MRDPVHTGSLGLEKGLLLQSSPHSYRCQMTALSGPDCHFSQSPLESSERPGSEDGAWITNHQKSEIKYTLVPSREG